MRTIRVAGAARLAPGETRVFSWPSPHGELQGFLIRAAGGLRAYENKCRHRPLPLDYGDEDFYSAAVERIVCKNHGATFDPDTGECDTGPCAGDRLVSFPLQLDGEDALVAVPA